MKKNTLILSILFLIINCSAQKITKKNKQKGVGIAKKTENPNIPKIYKNGYLNFYMEKVPVPQKNDTLNKLKFNAVYSAMYTQKVMYDKFGKWSKEIRPNNEWRHPILVWEKVKLFDDENKLYNVYAHGEEEWEEIYASVLVFDENQNDCLKENSPNKNKVTIFFAKGIQNLNSNEDFYKIYWDTVNKYKPQEN
ncbi:MAG: hypothetical protein JSS94_00665 [Bacteroidetes bacterium]|nr:hypothetical protein [Bacteroidota bacterium]